MKSLTYRKREMAFKHIRKFFSLKHYNYYGYGHQLSSNAQCDLYWLWVSSKLECNIFVISTYTQLLATHCNFEFTCILNICNIVIFFHIGSWRCPFFVDFVFNFKYYRCNVFSFPNLIFSYLLIYSIKITFEKRYYAYYNHRWQSRKELF